MTAELVSLFSHSDSEGEGFAGFGEEENRGFRSRMVLRPNMASLFYCSLQWYVCMGMLGCTMTLLSCFRSLQCVAEESEEDTGFYSEGEEPETHTRRSLCVAFR